MPTVIKYDRKRLKNAFYNDTGFIIYAFLMFCIPFALIFIFNVNDQEMREPLAYAVLGLAALFFIGWLSKLIVLVATLKRSNNPILEISNKGIEFKDKFYKWDELYYEIEQINHSGSDSAGEYNVTFTYLVFRFTKIYARELKLKLRDTYTLNKTIYEIVSICNNYRYQTNHFTPNLIKLYYNIK